MTKPVIAAAPDECVHAAGVMYPKYIPRLYLDA
jgi:hypothetical protein